ncbi:uncharacterized protein LOC107619430 isoform X5 [Arachis ipaensis]|uniref:uncharacterized protein LOC107619430 isoform X5 n=1 Tax=Arachis ipaensis TaxID=130454 RepID=UPI000A2B0319|nr:uncharacterized protein LOC107619430 isoform X5 [Arachis ipaensis]XP_025676286.1 uncharacterized protein LOC112776356 isoform X4 [Arachis hypogaea]
MEGSAYDLRLGAPHELDLTDLDHSMNRLNLSVSSSDPHHDHAPPQPQPPPPTSISDDVINHVDQFLRDAIHNPRERLSVLRIEEDIEKFIDDPSQQQLEFHRLPTSYLRLAAHRVAQHYSLPSMVLVDNTSPDGSGSRIIIHKTSECKMPLVRLADIPVKLSSEDNPAAVMKVAIKQRPNKQIQILGNANSNSVKSSNSKSMEERKDEYNRARERIFSSSSNGAIVGGKPECDLRKQDKTTVASLGVSRVEGKAASVAEINYCRGLVESSTNCSRSRSRTEKEQVGRYSQHNRVAIFRDREVDRKDPDYNRSYDSFLLNTIPNLFCSTYLVHGPRHPYLECDMDIQTPSCHHLILVIFLDIRLCTCIHLNILVSNQFLSSIMILFTNPLHSIINYLLMHVLD